jgi:hypothetical protein
MLDDNLKIAQIIQAILTSAGIIIAALSGYIVFVRQREAFPRVKISHRLRYDHLENSQALISLDVTVTNVGKMRVTLPEYQITVAQMLPPEDELQQFIVDKVLDGSKIGLDISQWKILASANKGNKSGGPPIELEPGEVVPIALNFLVRDSATLVQVMSEFPNKMRKSKTLRWEHRTIYDVKAKEGASDHAHVG